MTVETHLDLDLDQVALVWEPELAPRCQGHLSYDRNNMSDKH